VLVRPEAVLQANVYADDSGSAVPWFMSLDDGDANNDELNRLYSTMGPFFVTFALSSAVPHAAAKPEEQAA